MASLLVVAVCQTYFFSCYFAPPPTFFETTQHNGKANGFFISFYWVLCGSGSCVYRLCCKRSIHASGVYDRLMIGFRKPHRLGISFLPGLDIQSGRVTAISSSSSPFDCFAVRRRVDWRPVCRVEFENAKKEKTETKKKKKKE